MTDAKINLADLRSVARSSCPPLSQRFAEDVLALIDAVQAARAYIAETDKRIAEIANAGGSQAFSDEYLHLREALARFDPPPT